MKTFTYFLLLISFFYFSACSSSKKMKSAAIYDTVWELDYLTGPRIAFEGLYPDKKPQLTFKKETGKVEGHDSCNGYNAPFSLDGNAISFGEPGPSTLMYCGEGEKFFRSTLQKINSYTIEQDGKLNLMMDDVLMMRFKKL